MSEWQCSLAVLPFFICYVAILYQNVYDKREDAEKEGINMKIWQPSLREKRRYPWYMAGGVAGIAVLMVLLITGGVFLAFSLHLPMKEFSVVLCLLVTALAVWLAVRLGRKSVQNTLVFWLDDEDRLFALDVRQMVEIRRGFAGHISSALEIRKQLERLEHLPAGEFSALPGVVEILHVESIRELSHHTVLVCYIADWNGRKYNRTLLLVKGYEDEYQLLQQLERRRSKVQEIEIQEHRSFYKMLVSLAILLVMVGVCVLSHPAVGKLPQALYFPCLGLSLIPLFALVYYGIKHRRGE